MPACSVCRRDFPEGHPLCCHECGKAYCPDCAAKNATIEALGVCPDCEEVYEAEEDYFNWE